ncbi:MAG TPA: sodium/solute symporter [Candidatus Acidoferrum sp.]|jgi:SSS family solute:Na+ symporter|nr:sodium/solute symporter [Candidatus Acidoferrum sp.]
MNGYFSPGDWAIILLYLLGIIGLGLWFGKDQHNTRDYFLGSRNVPWWGIGLSIVAAETSALTIIGVPAMAYGGNIAFLQMILGYVIARILLAIILVPHYFKGEIYSPYQLFANTFGPAARQTAGGFFLLSETLAAGVRVYVASIPVKLMLGDKLLGFGTGDPILGAILLFVLLSLLYTYVGGVKAVIWTDAVQFGLFLLGGLFALCYIPTLVDGGPGAVLSRATDAGKLHWLNLTPPPGTPWVKFLLGAPFNLWMGIIGGTVLVLSSHGAEQLIVQRVLACKSVAEGRKALVLSAVVIFPLFLIFLLVGAMLWVFYQGHPFQIALPEPRPGSGIKANDFIFPIFMMTEVPHLVRGFLIVAILSAAMSSVSSALTSLASVSTMDFVKHLLPRKNEAFFLRFSKTSTVVWAGILILIAYLSRQVEFVLNAAFSLRGLTSGALVGGLTLAVLWRKGRALPIVAGMLVSLGTMTAVQVLPQWSLTKGFWMAWVGTEIFWPWYTLIGAVVTLGTAYLVRRLSGQR